MPRGSAGSQFWRSATFASLTSDAAGSMNCVATLQHCAPPVPAMSSAVAPPAARCGAPQLSAQQLEFLGNWQHSVQPRLQQLLTLLGQKDISRSLALAQVCTQHWTCDGRLLHACKLRRVQGACLGR